MLRRRRKTNSKRISAVTRPRRTAICFHASSITPRCNAVALSSFRRGGKNSVLQANNVARPWILSGPRIPCDDDEDDDGRWFICVFALRKFTGRVSRGGACASSKRKNTIFFLGGEGVDEDLWPRAAPIQTRCTLQGSKSYSDNVYEQAGDS